MASDAGNRIASLRKAQDISAEELAVHLKVSRAAICRYELGRAGVPDRHKLSLAELFGVSVSWLMNWPDGDNDNGHGEQERRVA